MEIEVLLTMTGSFLIAIFCGISAYRVAIREAKREIEEAFAEHIAQMHRDRAELEATNPPGGGN